MFEYVKRYRQSEKDKATKRRSTLKLREKMRAIVLDYKLNHPCVDCGEGDPVCLDFDHRDPKEKKYGIAALMQASYSVQTLLDEMQKCDIRCSNCHRKRTAREGHTRRVHCI